jgi:hypoxanthine phosphoribosyltransferase
VTATSAAGSGSSRRARRAAALPSRIPAETGETKLPRLDEPAAGSLQEPPAGEGLAPPERPAFAHASEAEMARILDFYQVRWEYEPHTFPILWNLEGMVVESFSPDFWLPDLDLYLEMTTLRQKLVRKKNRKLRRVLALYPDLRVKLFYARDFRALMLKFGKLALIDELSGTPGQVVPERLAVEIPDEPEVTSHLADLADLADPDVKGNDEP